MEHRLTSGLTALGGLAIVWSPAVWNPVGFVGYQPSKLLVGWIGCGLIALATCLARGDRGQPPRPVLVALGGVVITVTASTLFGEGGSAALLGWMPRAMGVAQWWYLAAVLLAGAMARTRWSLAQMVDQVRFVAAAVSAVGVLELVGVRLVGPGLDRSRVISVFGSATVAGAFAAMVLPLLADRIFRRGLRAARWDIAIGAITVVFLVATRTRAAWLAAVVGVGVVAAARPHRRELKKAVWWLAGVVGAGVVAVAAVPALRQRVGTLPGSGRGRLALWRAAIRAAGDRPILGWGAESGRRVLPLRLPSTFEARFGDSVLEDRAHNVVLDHLVVAGIVGALALVALMVVVARIIANRRTEPGVLGIAGLLVAYAVHLCVNFVATEPDALAWFFAGAATSVTVAPVTRQARRAVRAVAGLGTAIACVGAVIASRLVVADTYLKAATDREDRRQVGAADEAFVSASAWASEQPLYWEVLARARLRAGDVDGAVWAAERAVGAAAGDPTLRELWAEVTLERGLRRSDRADVSSALAVYRELVTADDRNGSTHLGLGTALAGLGQLESALIELRRSTELTPTSPDGWRRRAVVADTLGLCAEAADSLARVHQLGDDRPFHGESKCG